MKLPTEDYFVFLKNWPAYYKMLGRVFFVISFKKLSIVTISEGFSMTLVGLEQSSSAVWLFLVPLSSVKYNSQYS